MNKEYKEQYIVVAPYWNVNLVESYLTLQMQLIVVAPYWNVNVNKLATAPIALPHSSSSILECKC